MIAIIAVTKRIAKPKKTAQKGGMGNFRGQEWFEKRLRDSNPFDQYLLLIFMTHFAKESTVKACE